MGLYSDLPGIAGSVKDEIDNQLENVRDELNSIDDAIASIISEINCADIPDCEDFSATEFKKEIIEQLEEIKKRLW